MVKKLNNIQSINTDTVFSQNIIDLNKSNTIVSSTGTTLTLENLSSTLYREVSSQATGSVTDIILPTSQEIINHFNLNLNDTFIHRVFLNSRTTNGSHFFQFPTTGCLFISPTTNTRGSHIIDYHYTYTNLSGGSLVVSKRNTNNVNTASIGFENIFI